MKMDSASDAEIKTVEVDCSKENETLKTSEINKCIKIKSKSCSNENFKNFAYNSEETIEDDFQTCNIASEFKITQNRKKKENSFFCVVCKSDLSNLKLDSRTVHINQCLDSQSSNVEFNSATSESFILECPLCFKNFPTPEIRSSHIKKCGKSKGLSIQSVIQALQLQEKHILERRALGLPFNKIKQPKLLKKPSLKKFTVEPKSAMQSDIQLAKALSLSLEDAACQGSQRDILSQREEIPTQRILHPPLDIQSPGKKVPNKKMKLFHTPLLLLRTEEERKKIILDKVNAIIMPQGQLEKEIVSDDSFKHKEIQDHQKAVLWDLCGKAENKSSYYVEQLSDWIALSNVDPGSKLCNLSQIPGHHIYTQLPCDYTFSCSDENEDTETSLKNNDSSSLVNSLRSLIGNSWMSDVDIHTASGIVVPAHKLILALRCPTLKKIFASSSKDERIVLDFKNTSFDATLHFLNFLYTDSTEWKEDIIEDLTTLAKLYDVKDLLNILDSDCGTLELMSIENTQMNINSPIKAKLNIDQNFSSPNKKECSSSNEYIDVDLPEVKSNDVKLTDESELVCLKSCTENNDACNTDETTLEALSLCNDILGNLNNQIFNSNLHSGQAENLSKKRSGSHLSPKYFTTPSVEIDIVENSSSNDSCKIVHDDYDSTRFNETPEKIAPLSSKTECIMSHSKKLPLIDSESSNESKNYTFACKSYSALNSSATTPIKSFNFSKEIACEEIADCDEVSIVNDIQKTLKRSLEAFNDNCNPKICINVTRDPIENLPSSFNSSALDIENTINKKTNHQSLLCDTHNIKSTLTTDKNSSFESELSNSNQHIYDYESPEKNYSTNNNQSNVFDHQILTSPEIIICDSDDETNSINNDNKFFQSQNRTYSEESEKKLSSKTLEFDPLRERTAHNTLFVEEALNSNKKSQCLEELVFNSKVSMRKKNIECSLDSNKDSNFLTQEKLGCYTQNTSDLKPEIITYVSDEENIKNYPSLLSKLDDEKEIYHNTICHSPSSNDLRHRENNTPEFETKASNDSDIFISEKANEIEKNVNLSNHMFWKENSVLIKDRNDEWSRSPESPWVIKHKQSEEDFELPKRIQRSNEILNSSLESKTNKVSLNDDLDGSNKTPLIHVKKKILLTKSDLSTPTSVLQQFKYSDSPITPLPNYQNMVTPEIKEALKKIGVKALPRKKAIAVLSHVYEETHPLIEGSSNIEIKRTIPEPTSKLSRQKKPKNSKVAQKRKRNEEESYETAQKPSKVLSSPAKDSSFSSPDSDNNKKNAYNLSFSSDFSDSSQAEGKEKVQLVSDYILNNEELYKQILTYTPLNLAEFQGQLKENGINIGLQKLMDFLDEQCITFHYPRNEVYRKKQQVRTQRFRKRMIAKLSQNTQSNS